MTELSDLDPELTLAIGYARPEDRSALSALFALDATFARILRSTGEPLVGQMRLTWWHEGLERIDSNRVPAEPVLQALAAHVVTRGISGAALARLIEGWEALLDLPLTPEALRVHGRGRGAALFVLAGEAIGAESGLLAKVGEGWALADLARHLSDRGLAHQAIEMARPLLDEVCAGYWPRSLRALGALAHRARLDLAAPLGTPIPTGAPHRVARMFWHRISGK